jgi:hypothetical protein
MGTTTAGISGYFNSRSKEFGLGFFHRREISPFFQ